MQDMAIIGGKRLETVPVKFSESEKAELQRLAQSEDRGVGYIVRELAFRGLAKYREDGKLKLTLEEENGIEATFHAKVEARAKFTPKVATKPASSKKIVPNDEDMGLQFSGGRRKTSKQKEAELNQLMDEAIDKVKKNKK